MSIDGPAPDWFTHLRLWLSPRMYCHCTLHIRRVGPGHVAHTPRGRQANSFLGVAPLFSMYVFGWGPPVGCLLLGGLPFIFIYSSALCVKCGNLCAWKYKKPELSFVEVAAEWLRVSPQDHQDSRTKAAARGTPLGLSTWAREQLKK